MGSTRSILARDRRQPAFRHEAWLYSGEDEFVDHTTGFIRDGLDAGEHVLVIVVPPKIDLLRDALGDDSRSVLFADMAEVGRNPARIIPVWREFVDGTPDGTAVRGIGEPIWSGRSPQEIIESQRHEALINLAFQGAPAWILCPYDTKNLDATVIDEALRSHPVVTDDGSETVNVLYRGLDAIAAPFDSPLPDPPADALRLGVQPDTLDSLRGAVARLAQGFGLGPIRRNDLVLAVNEVATNTLRHAGGKGEFRAWHQDDRLVVEISDRGRIDQPLVGRLAPRTDRESGFGLWIVNQLCDLVQVRTDADGSVVRLHMDRR